VLTTPTLAQVELVVHGRIRQVLAERGEEIPPLAGAEKLSATLGLSSLDLALLVAELEAELGVDPFREARFNHQRPIGERPRAGLSTGVLSGASARRGGWCDRGGS